MLPPHLIEQANHHAWHASLGQASTQRNIHLLARHANPVAAFQRLIDAVNAHAALTAQALKVLFQTVLHDVKHAGIGICLIANSLHQSVQVGAQFAVGQASVVIGRKVVLLDQIDDTPRRMTRRGRELTVT